MHPISVEEKVKHSHVWTVPAKGTLRVMGWRGKKRKDKWENHNLPRGNRAKLKRFGNTRMENNATVNFTAEHSPGDLDRLLKSGPSFGVCFGTDRLLRPAEGRQVWGGKRCPLPEHENGAHIWTGVQTCKSHGTFYWCIQVSVTEAIKSSPLLP